jgi:hypothetical protein
MIKATNAKEEAMQRRSGLCLIAVMLALNACGVTEPGRSDCITPIAQTNTPAPTVSTAPTALPMPTAPFDPSAPTTIPYGMLHASAIARATALPFPTAEPATVQSGQPASATVRRNQLSLHVQLAQGAYLAGEGGQAKLTLHNDGAETLFVSDYGVSLLDEQGQQPKLWPPSIWRGGIPRLQELAPGGTITATLTFQVPPQKQAIGHDYTLWASARFSRAIPGGDHGAANLWMDLEAGPIPLQVSPPTAAQQLHATLEVDQTGWRLHVVDPNGQTPLSPLWGEFEAASYGGSASGSLRDNGAGIWREAWPEHMLQSGSTISVRAWVAAPGYVTVAASQELPGCEETSPGFSDPAPTIAPTSIIVPTPATE